MFIDFLIERFKKNRQKEAIIWRDNSNSYEWLLNAIDKWQKFFKKENIKKGEVVLIESQPHPFSISLLFALIENQNIIIPITTNIESKKMEFIEISQPEKSISFDNDFNPIIKCFNDNIKIDLYKKLRSEGHPGLILFSSGTSGKIKAALHDLSKLLVKYLKIGKDFRTLAFMLFDHIGGVDTLFYSLSNSSSIVLLEERLPEIVFNAIEKYKVEVLPVTPTFLNMLILSEAYKNYDFTSLKIITYGTEVMPEYTLKLCSKLFPEIKIIQKYGTTEVGTLRSKSKSSESTLVKIGGEGYQTRIIDGILQIKAESAMIGYLNAPSPFTEDGWFITGDEVEVDGEYIRFLGRKSEIINVGGEKVFPIEVENIIQQIDNVADVTVFGEKNTIMGNIVCAKITVDKKIENINEFKKKIKRICLENLEPYKVPVKIIITEQVQHTERFKKAREADVKTSD
jgi:long-chain acyl-CoA synthetase